MQCRQTNVGGLPLGVAESLGRATVHFLMRMQDALMQHPMSDVCSAIGNSGASAKLSAMLAVEPEDGLSLRTT